MSNPSSLLAGKTLVVIGGGKGWGSKIAAAALRIGATVLIVERETSEKDREAMIAKADTVFLAPPETEIEPILHALKNLLIGKNIIDCATNKGPFLAVLTELSRETSVCSTHPLVRSETPSRGQAVLIMPFGEKAETATQQAEELYATLQMRLHRFEFERHGDLMAIVQFLPHLMQRTLIDTLGKVLETKGLTLADIADITPANFGMTEMGMGRMAIQRPDVSAGIIAEALNGQFGKDIHMLVQDSLWHMGKIGTDREALCKFALEGAQRLDPKGTWRKEMNVLTDTHIEARGNFKLRSFVLIVRDDRPGLLRDIGSLLAEFDLNMNAIHSHALEREDGHGVRFSIGVEQQNVDWEALEQACEERGWEFVRVG